MNIRTLLRWTGRTVAGILVLVVVAYGSIHLLSVKKANASVMVAPHSAPSADAADPALLAEGKRLAAVRGCIDCHASNLGGRLFIDDPMIGTVYAANLTAGKGGRGATMTAEDWELAVRHGVRRDGSQLAVMPSNEFATMTDEDLAAIIAYARSVPAVDNETAPPKLGPLGHVLHVAGQLPAYPASGMTQSTSHRAAIVPAVSMEYGEYIAHGCTGCHGAGFSGGKIPGTPPSFPAAANITPDSVTGIGTWSEADFIRALREGVAPGGRKLDPFMPVQLTKLMNDTELKAAYMYLRTVPVRAEGNR